MVAAVLALAALAGAVLAPVAGHDGEAAAAGEFRLVVPSLAADSPPAPAPFVTAHGVRSCAYVPGFSQPARMPPEVINAIPPPPHPGPALPANSAVAAALTAKQMTVFDQLAAAVTAYYVDPAFNGVDWPAISARYEELIAGGLTDADFYAAMKAMIRELGDQHSSFESPEEVRATEERLVRGESFVGIGATIVAVPGTGGGTILSIWPDSPALLAGLKPHDVILSVNGGPLIDSKGDIATRGPAGTTITLVVARPGDSPRTMQLVRRAVTGFTPVDSCIVPNTRVGYIFIPTLYDLSIGEQVRTALQKLTADGPLAGLVLDNRMNGGGIESVAKSVLGFFTSGNQGARVSRTAFTPFNITPEDIGGSQQVPLVVLVDWETASYGEIMSGVLAGSGRATIAGRTTLGNVEILRNTDLPDGSRAWIARETFQPVGKPAGYWEGKGIIAAVSVPTRWDLFTEATDPALARAVSLLLGE